MKQHCVNGLFKATDLWPEKYWVINLYLHFSDNGITNLKMPFNSLEVIITESLSIAEIMIKARDIFDKLEVIE
jgi:hypothetical protein